MSRLIDFHKNLMAKERLEHKRSPQHIIRSLTGLFHDPMNTKGKALRKRRTTESLADIENTMDATEREVEPSVRSLLRRIYEDNLDEILSTKKKGGQVKKKRKKIKKKPRGWGKARYGSK